MAPARQRLGAALRSYTNDVGRYDAVKVAHRLDWQQQEIARFLAKDASAVSRNPAASSYQDLLPRLVALFERITELAGGDVGAANAWMRTPLVALDGASPKSLIIEGKVQVVEHLLDEFESGAAL